MTPPEGQLFAADLGGVGGRMAGAPADGRARACERAAELADDGEQWIVWCGLNDEANLAAKLIDGAVNVEGSWSPDAKAQALEAFQDGEIRVLVTKPSIAGFGMNFQNCSRMAFVGLSDSYESYYQAVRRCWRYGQTEPVAAHIIVSGLESQIVENVARKERQAAQRDGGADPTHGNREETASMNNDDAYITDDAEGEGWRLMLGDSCERLGGLAERVRGPFGLQPAVRLALHLQPIATRSR